MKKAIFIVLTLLGQLNLMAQVERPKLVVGLVADQMRWDYLYYYYDQYGEGGIKRLLKDGFSCENCMIPYTPTITGIGHASIYTGCSPALHGIAGNDFEVNGNMTYCCWDETMKTIGSNTDEGRKSPHLMLSTTIGDALKIHTDYKSKVIGVAMKDRAAILPAGHAADAAYWYDNGVGHYVTSSYYMDKLPEWVEQFNKENNTKPGFDLKCSNEGVTMTFKMAKAIVDNEKMGQHDVTDMLCVSVSSTDAIGHAFSTRGKENYEVYMQFDRDLADFLKYLDKKVGKGNYLLFLSADHGGAHNPNQMNDHKIPAGGWDGGAARRALNEHLQAKFGIERGIRNVCNYNFYVNRDAVRDAGLDFDEVKAEAIRFLKQDKQYDYVVDLEDAANSTMPAFIRERVINGYSRFRSGDIQVITHPGYINAYVDRNYRGTTHGAWNPYDSHIPCVFMGWKVKPGESSVPVTMCDIAPTVCEMLHIQMPNACMGNAILPVLGQ